MAGISDRNYLTFKCHAIHHFMVTWLTLGLWLDQLTIQTESPSGYIIGLFLFWVSSR